MILVTILQMVSLQVDVVDSEDELAGLFLTKARYEQALQEVLSLGGGTFITKYRLLHS